MVLERKPPEVGSIVKRPRGSAVSEDGPIGANTALEQILRPGSVLPRRGSVLLRGGVCATERRSLCYRGGVCGTEAGSTVLRQGPQYSLPQRLPFAIIFKEFFFNFMQMSIGLYVCLDVT